MTNRTPWTPAENAALVRLYFRMLDAATTGRPYTKAAMIRHVQQLPHGRDDAAALANRSRGSIEAKLMNASAAHRDLCPEAETMDGHGYRALSNYQRTLRDAMAEAIARRAGLELLPEAHPARAGQ
jgi:hypothetical protein